jgi:glycosyltransferase involved in cell wall biosynthesis
VARIITRLNIGGPSIQAARLTTALDAHGFPTRLLHGRLGAGEGDMRYLVPDSANVVFVPTLCRPLAPLDDLRTLWRLYRQLADWQPRIVHTHMAKAGLLGRVAATLYNLTQPRAARTRIVHTYHGHVLEGYFSAPATRVFIVLERLMARATDRIVAISPAIRSELLDLYRVGRPDQYRVVSLGFDLTPFAAVDERTRAAARAALHIPSDVPVVGTVGRLTAIKQHTLFLDVVKELAAAHPRLVALVAGDGEEREALERHATAAGLADRVRFLGWRRDLTTVYGATDVFVLTSRNEGTPVALIEAMAAGVPGVSTDVGGVKDVIDSPDVGVLAPFGDVAALAAGVLRLLDDPAARAAMGARARQTVIDRFGLERLVADIVALYRELLNV